MYQLKTFKPATAMLSLALLVAVLWSVIFGRWRPSDWSTPVTYFGDGILALTLMKLAGDGDLTPVGYVNSASLGAPFTANLNDYPTSERTILWLTGLVSRVTGLGLAANLALICAHVIAALSFYLACRLWRVSPPVAWCMAVPYAFTPYILTRSLPHFGLTCCGLFPLQLFVCWYLATSDELSWRSNRFKLALLVALLSGTLNVYYIFIFLQFCAFAVLFRIIRRKPFKWALLPPVLTGAVTALILGSYILYGLTHGKNDAAVVRIYGDLESVALKPLDLLIPLPGYAFNWFNSVYAEYSSHSAFRPLESDMVYMGLIAISGLFLLFVRSVINQFRGSPPPLSAMLVLWILAFACFGGINALSGLLTHFYLFRGTNRYSIVIVTVAFLYLARQLDGWTARWPTVGRLSLVALIAIFGLCEQAMPFYQANNHGLTAPVIARIVESDRELTEQLEELVPPKSMIFQLPVMDFPEVPPLNHLNDYEHFRPFLFSHQLHFSYGSNKGRPIDAWQHDVAIMPAPAMVAALKSYGFAGILLNRKGYADNAAALTSDLTQMGLEPDLDRGEWVFYRLAPSARSSRPPISTFVFTKGWMALEIFGYTWFHWAADPSGSEIKLTADSDGAYRARFILGTISARQVQMTLDDLPVETYTFNGSGEQTIELKLNLSAGAHRLRFVTDQPAVSANNGDPRLFTFYVKNLQVSK